MKELKDIVQPDEIALNQGIKTALATVAYVEGRSYRSAAARLLIAETGHLTGAIIISLILTMICGAHINFMKTTDPC